MRADRKTSSHFIDYANGSSYVTTYFQVTGREALTPDEYLDFQEKLEEMYWDVIKTRENEKNTN